MCSTQSDKVNTIPRGHSRVCMGRGYPAPLNTVRCGECPHPATPNTIPNNTHITNVFVINIRKDLLKKITYIFDFFNQSKINIERIEGVDSMKLYNNDKLFFNKLIINNDLSLNGYGFRKCKEEVIGEIGCFLAHKKCWKKIVNNKQKNTLILINL